MKLMEVSASHVAVHALMPAARALSMPRHFGVPSALVPWWMANRIMTRTTANPPHWTAHALRPARVRGGIMVGRGRAARSASQYCSTRTARSLAAPDDLPTRRRRTSTEASHARLDA